MELSNASIVKKLRQVAAAHQLKNDNLFKIRAYENAADSIEHSTYEVKVLWEEGRLDQIPGIGQSLKNHLEELFKTGKVKHWEKVKQGIPKVVFDLLDIEGIGPKTASNLASLGIKNIEDLKDNIKSGNLVSKGFSAKVASKIFSAILEYESRSQGRMLLPYAFTQAERVLEYMKKCPEVIKVDPLGSLRRMVATIGDLDFSISSKNPQDVVDHIIKMPGVVKVVEKGHTQATIVLFSGLHIDFLISQPESYGALLQHFTGSKSHNIHLRKLAERLGFSLSEYGIKNVKTHQIIPCQTEDQLYKYLKMQTPPPELREDSGEIEASLKHQLPNLIEINDIKGDIHTHSNYPLEPSHGPGANTLQEMAEKAKRLGYDYLGSSDHPPSVSGHPNVEMVGLIKKRADHIASINSSKKYPKLLNLLEVDILPDGSLSVPDEGLHLLDFAIVGIHSSHKMVKGTMTKRILKAMDSPYVKVLVHPTGRLLNERESYQADWEEIFNCCVKNNQAVEINGYPNRLDLPDSLVRFAKSLGVKFVINTDAHEKSQMENMRFGVSVARRGWLEAKDIINTWDLQKVFDYFKIS